jgi:hypothetical protein
MGLGVQFLERRADIMDLMHLDQMQPNCEAWRTYAATSPYLPKVDSGLRKRMEMGGMEWDGEPVVRRIG